MHHGTHMKLMLGGVAGFVVLAALGLPVLSYLPLFIILLCPLMMMGGMDHGGDSRDEDEHAAHRH